MLGDGVTDTLCKDTLHVGAERSARVAGLGVVGDVGRGGLRDTEHVRPLLDLFPEILGVKGGIAENTRQSAQLKVGKETMSYIVPCQN